MTFAPARLLTAALVVAPLALAGCGSGNAEPEQPTVMAALYPYQFVAERVAGPTATVVGLTPAGAEPHDLELTPKQVTELGDADLLIYQQGLQPAVEAAAEQQTQVDVLPVPSPTIKDKPDPHVWLDPVKLAGVASLVAKALAEKDPTNAAAYESRAAALAGELKALDSEFSQALGGLCKRRTIVTSHAAFGHLAKRYQLKQIPIAGIEPDSEPSPKQIDEVSKAVRKYKVTTIFFETLLDPKIAKVIAKDTDAETAVLDPVESPADGGDYFTQMRANLAALQKALDCS